MQDPTERIATINAILKQYSLPFALGAGLAAAATMTMADPLHTAVVNDDLGLARQEIASGADVNQEEPFLGSPLTIAINAGNEQMVSLLVSHGASLEVEDPASGSPLHTAAAKGHLGIVKALIDAGADINAIRDSNGESPLHSAAQSGNEEIVELLITMGANVNARSSERYGPIHTAAAAGHFDIVELLRSLGATSEPIAELNSLIRSADPTEGERLFNGFCENCHSPDKGGPNRIGPNLWGIVGRQRASAPDFDYSKAMMRHGGSWDFNSLNVFIAQPTDFIPGTKMSAMISFLDDPNERAHVISYLRELSDNPAAYPD